MDSADDDIEVLVRALRRPIYNYNMSMHLRNDRRLTHAQREGHIGRFLRAKAEIKELLDKYCKGDSND